MKPILKIQDAMLLTSTEQEIFDFVGQHLLRQNKKAGIVDEGCKYRLQLSPGSKVLMCGIGACISDAVYHKKLEGKSASRLMRVAFHHILPTNETTRRARLEFLDALQNVHDDWEVEEWPGWLQAFASTHSLIFDEQRLRNAPIIERE